MAVHANQSPSTFVRFGRKQFLRFLTRLAEQPTIAQHLGTLY